VDGFAAGYPPAGYDPAGAPAAGLAPHAPGVPGCAPVDPDAPGWFQPVEAWAKVFAGGTADEGGLGVAVAGAEAAGAEGMAIVWPPAFSTF